MNRERADEEFLPVLMTFKTLVLRFLYIYAAEFVHIMNIVIPAYRTLCYISSLSTFLAGGVHLMPPCPPLFVS